LTVSSNLSILPSSSLSAFCRSTISAAFLLIVARYPFLSSVMSTTASFKSATSFTRPPSSVSSLPLTISSKTSIAKP
jgi:hypothetical protein